jgi:hypothetical protein
MVWDGYRSTTVRSLAVAQHNSYAPGFLDIGAEEIGKFCKPEVGARLSACTAQAGPAPVAVKPAAASPSGASPA